MDDQISRTAAIEDIEALMRRYREIGAECDRDGALFARERIKKLPSVDAVPVEWLKHRLIMAQKNGSEVPEQAIRYVLWLWEQQHDGERRDDDGTDA